jgi:hypothetical protein
LSAALALPIVLRIVAKQDGGVVVKLIDTDGMALIGPGSEWAWRERR